MKTLKILFCAAIATAANLANATPLDPHRYPKELIYLGKPLQPGCFSTMGHQSDDNKYDLRECSTQNEKYKITYNDYLTKKGFYGRTWEKEAVNADDYSENGYDYYKAWPAGDSRYWIVAISNGGGTGIFTSINLFTRVNNNIIKIETIDGGDRCNGGIDLDAIQLTKQGIQFITNVSAADFLSINNSNPHHLEAYDDLAACAQCCTAKAVYEVDPNLESKLLYIDIGSNSNTNEMPEQGKYQYCFNKLQASYVSRGMNKLNESQLSKFMNDFDRLCAK